jgi:hypothetical protein
MQFGVLLSDERVAYAVAAFDSLDFVGADFMVVEKGRWREEVSAVFVSCRESCAIALLQIYELQH